jgi:hypothetical protein
MRLLTAHRILVAASIGLQGLLVLWSAVHRDRPGAWLPGVLALVTMPILALYLRKLYRNPPIK